MGLACVATDVFGVSELFQEGKSGLMVKKGDSQGIFNAIKSLFSNPELKQKIEKNGSELIRTSFTMEKMVNNIEELFLELLDKKVNASDKE